MNWIHEEALLFSHPDLHHLFIRAGVIFLIDPRPDLIFTSPLTYLFFSEREQFCGPGWEGSVPRTRQSAWFMCSQAVTDQKARVGAGGGGHRCFSQIPGIHSPLTPHWRGRRGAGVPGVGDWKKVVKM